jgi:hypothetical protein
MVIKMVMIYLVKCFQTLFEAIINSSPKKIEEEFFYNYLPGSL